MLQVFSFRRPFAWALAAAAVAVPVVFAAGGCGRGEQVNRTPVHLIVGWDTSESASDLRRRLSELGVTTIRKLDASQDTITLLRMDRVTSEFYSGKPKASREQMQPVIVKALKPQADRRGTHVAEFWVAVATRVQRSDQPVAVLLLTDGGNDDRSTAAMTRMRSAVDSLASNPRLVAVEVWGVRPALRDAVRADLEPLTDRLEVRGVDDVDQQDFIARVIRHAQTQSDLASNTSTTAR